MKMAAIVIVSFILFVAAAAWHGRQLRLEREQAGYMQVTFGRGDNPPFVEALWRAERIRFWSLALVLAAGAIATAIVRKRDYGLTAVAAGLWAPSISFVIFGIASALRTIKG
jgi:hypothetical protein